LCIHHPVRLSSPGVGTFMSAFEYGWLLYRIFIFHIHLCHGHSIPVPSSIKLTPQIPHHPNIACKTPETALSVVKSVHYRLSGRLLPIPKGIDAINDLFRNHGAFYALSMVTNSLTDVSTRVRGLTPGLAGLRIAEQGSFEVIT
jgi:hypothetical protein